jgi:hypothetical protein
MNGTGTRRQFIPKAARLSSRAAFVCALVLRQNNTQHLLRGPKGPVRIQSEEETIYSPLLMALGNCMGDEVFPRR